MNRRWLIYLGLVFIVATATPARGTAAERLRVLPAALVLLDPHAASADKFDACIRLRNLGDAAILAIPALARQSKYDQPHIREMAFGTLIRLVGYSEAVCLRGNIEDSSFDEGRMRLRTWILSVEIWEDGTRAGSPRFYTDGEWHRAGVKAALLLWNKTHACPTDEIIGIDRATKSDLLNALAAGLSTFKPERRTLALRLGDALGLEGPASVPLVLAGIADEDADARAIMQKHANELFRPNSNDPGVVEGLVRAVTLPKQLPHVSAAADRCLETMGPRARSIAIDLTLARLIQGYPEAMFTLVAWSANRSPLAEAVMALGAVPTGQRAQLAQLLTALAKSPDDARNEAVGLLCADDRSLRDRTAGLIAADVARFDRHAVLKETVQAGVSQSPQLLARLELDPKIINPQIVPLLEAREVRVRFAACSVLKVTGITGDGVSPALEALLADTDDSVCYAAAELLGRSDILIRLQIPPLLRELRNEVLIRRMVAARQLEELGVEPKEITAALRRAVDRRDMAVREGLVAALESGYVKRKPTLEMLDEAAGQQSDAASRAYARAALRELEAARKRAG
ncbi:MAG: hypothetical protein JWN40_1911 [Phycisphaerales bacterium]|nr:hypothetical protein [Phycisphaerales bacterium]